MSSTEYDIAVKDFPANSTWKHIEGGDYKIVGVEWNATGYEKTHTVKPVLRYEQQFQGSFPPGTMWIRDVEDFRANFSLKQK